MSNIIPIESETMCSSQLAEMLCYEKKEINRKIKAMFQEKIEGGIISPTLRVNGQVDEYHLPELESKMFVAKHDTSYLEQITQFWIDRKALSPAETIIVIGQNMLRLENEQKRIDAEQRQLNSRQNKVESEIKALSGQLEQMSIKAYCNLNDIKISNKEANTFGRMATKYSNENDYHVGKVVDPVYGQINAYDQEVLDKVVKH